MTELLEAIGIGLVLLLPLSNPLTAVALFLGLSEGMNFQERNRQAQQAAGYVFLIMLVTWFAGTIVLNAFGISIPGLRIAGGLIVLLLGFQMLFPQKKLHDTPEVRHKQEELQASDNAEETVNIAFVPIAMPGTAGPGTLAVIMSTASTVKAAPPFAQWILIVAPVVTFILVAALLWVCLRSSGTIMRILGKSGIEAISRLMGFLLVCMGVQFAINGVTEIVHNLS
jgi:multiple antibiotic resistance protein